jgi:long-chain acyl-CoA synthetase
LAAASTWRSAAGLAVTDRVLCLATLNNGLAFNTSLLPVLLGGGLIAFHAGRPIGSALVRCLEAVRPTVLVAFPFVYEQLQERAIRGRFPDLRLAVSSAAPLRTSARDNFLANTGLPICDYYGLVEVGPGTYNDGRCPESLGTPLEGVSLRVTDVDGTELPVGTAGRLRIKTASMATAFLDDGPSFATLLDDAGYYVTSDSGTLGLDGALRLGSRLDTLINVAGRKIAPSEVARVLGELAGVDAVVVRGEEHDGRTLVAAYLESQTVTKEQVVAFCQDRLAPYKIPQLIRIVSKLPRSATGKVSANRLESLT